MLSYKKIIHYRSIWMALAAIWIVYYHSGLPSFGPVTLTIKSLGYGGVDIFVFASGLGCYYSLSKNPDILTFWKKRLTRILPTYYLVLIPWIFYQAFRYGVSFQAIIANFLCIDFLIQSDFEALWYMNAMWVYYVLALFFVPFCQRASKCRQIVLFLFCLFCSLPFIGDVRLMLTSRIPIFYLGVLFAHHSKKDSVLTHNQVFATISCCAIGFLLVLLFRKFYPDFLWDYGLQWWPFILITPGLCLLISFIASLVDSHIPSLNHCFFFIGKCTLEIYTIHALLFLVIKNAMSDGLFYGTDKRWLVFCIIPFILSGLLVKFHESVSSKLLIAAHHKQQGE